MAVKTAGPERGRDGWSGSQGTNFFVDLDGPLGVLGAVSGQGGEHLWPLIASSKRCTRPPRDSAFHPALLKHHSRWAGLSPVGEEEVTTKPLVSVRHQVSCFMTQETPVSGQTSEARSRQIRGCRCKTRLIITAVVLEGPSGRRRPRLRSAERLGLETCGSLPRRQRRRRPSGCAPAAPPLTAACSPAQSSNSSCNSDNNSPPPTWTLAPTPSPGTSNSTSRSPSHRPPCGDT